MSLTHAEVDRPVRAPLHATTSALLLRTIGHDHATPIEGRPVCQVPDAFEAALVGLGLPVDERATDMTKHDRRQDRSRRPNEEPPADRVGYAAPSPEPSTRPARFAVAGDSEGDDVRVEAVDRPGDPRTRRPLSLLMTFDGPDDAVRPAGACARPPGGCA